jgi:hypothetical protein
MGVTQLMRRGLMNNLKKSFFYLFDFYWDIFFGCQEIKSPAKIHCPKKRQLRLEKRGYI